jgi:myo-inositol 2-dehydrogenase/D-chiro-inositol 1-dehydrogenase
MTLRVGVIGVGAIGQDHIRRLTHVISGARVVALTDVDAQRAQSAAGSLDGARVHATGQDLIDDGDVDAILVTSWGPTHEEYVLASIAAGKPVFCEKPLAPTPDACLRIVKAEVARGQRLVQVGFMRRYDAGYRAMKKGLARGTLGAPLLAHCAHRNPTAPPYGFTSEMMISDSAVHEIDIVRWLFDQEIAAGTVLKPRRTTLGDPNLQDPLIMILEMADGVVVDVEVFVNCGYGYDIRCEVVAESGTVALSDGGEIVITSNGLHSRPVPADWRERFVRAYDVELQEWVEAVSAGDASGPSSWDGYAAAAVVERCLEALQSGQRSTVQLEDRPELYRTPGGTNAVEQSTEGHRASR